MTIILGIDPGLTKTGWGVISSSGHRLSYIDCGTIYTDTKLSMGQRLMEIYQGLRKVGELHRPEHCAIEETFVNKNALTSLKLGHARGAAMLAIASMNIEIYEYAATLVKKSVVGVGRADKQQILRMVKYLLPIAAPDSEDAADALASAICHSGHVRSKL
jgi:crossover junction endodeoxyribonuclease RuvC